MITLPLLLLACLTSFVACQYPHILYDSTITLGQCLSDRDCDVYLLYNASLQLSGLYCNPITSRCELDSGEALDYAYLVECPDTTMTVARYPSMADDADIGGVNSYAADGIMIVDLAFSSFTFEGVLRLYKLPFTTPITSYINDFNYQGSYYEEQFVNSPTTRYVFRNLFAHHYVISDPVIYTIAVFFDISGCVVYDSGPDDQINCIYMGCTGSGTFSFIDPLNQIYQPTPPSRELVMPNVVTNVNANGRFASMQLDPLHWDFSNIIYTSLATGPHRCPFGQVLDMSGRVLSSKIEEELLEPDALRFPLAVPDTQNLTSKLAGFVQLQLGMGYCINSGGTRYIIRDENGIFEGFMAQKLVLDLSSDVAPAIPPYAGGFNTSVMFHRLHLVHFNTYLLRNSGPPDPFGAATGINADFTKVPLITILDNAVNQTASAHSFCQSSGTVLYNYDGLELGSGGFADLKLFKINISDPFMGETLVAQQNALFLQGSFTVTDWGFYCLGLYMNFIDGLGKRRVLNSCFQVGRLAATITQLRSYFVDALPANPYPLNGFPYAGYGSYVTTVVYVGLPPFLVLEEGFYPQVRVFRFSPDAYDNSQLELYDATDIEVYSNEMGYLDVEDLYVVLTSDENVTVYYRNESNFNKDTYATLSYMGAGTVATEVSYVRMEIIRPEQLLGPDVPITIPEDVDYQCSLVTALNLISQPRLRNAVTVTEGTCPADLAKVIMFTVGGICGSVWNPLLATYFGNTVPNRSPCTYTEAFYNVDDPDNPIPLYARQNAYLYGAPANTNLMAVSVDIMGNVARTFFYSQSTVNENSTVITFLDPVPMCSANGTQAVTHEFVLGGAINAVVFNGTANVTYNAIYGWEPLNVLAIAQYNPNTPFFNLPSDCALLNTYTEQEVYALCYNVSLISNPQCTGCNKLPIQYEGANGTKITRTTRGSWNAYVWVPTTIFDPDTGRPVFCRFELSVIIRIPDPLTILLSSLRRIKRGGSQCNGDDCFAVDIQLIVDPNFSVYAPLVTIAAAPPFSSLVDATASSPPALSANSRGVIIDTDYLISLTLDDVFCPSIIPYRADAVGPVIQVVRTTHSVCNSATGTAMFFASYVNADVTPGTVANLCMFWPNYETEFFSFSMPVNAFEPTVLPFSPDFFVSENITLFYNVDNGLQTVILFDACVGGINCGPSFGDNCASLINQNTYVVSSGLNFHVFQFVVEQFALPGGGLEVVLNNRTDAMCYGDTYELEFSVYDDLGEDNAVYGPYQWQLFEPRSGDLVSESFTPCVTSVNQLTQVVTVTGGEPLFDPLPVVNFKVKLFDITTFIRTGTQYGFRESGNFTLVVTNCVAGCVKTFDVFIDIVNPFDIILNGVDSTCAYGQGAIMRSWSGGKPFGPGELYDQSYYPNDIDNDFIVNGQYITEWKTPANPLVFSRTRLLTKQNPGNYTVRLTDANGCQVQANVTIKSPPPMTVTVLGVEAACTSSTTATVQFVVSGGTGPPYYTLQNLTMVEVGENITMEFVSAFDQTLCFHIMDSVGCIYPTEVCFLIPKPAPISVNITAMDSCPNSATGTAVAVSNTTGSYTCSWSAAGVTFAASHTCTQTNIPAGSQLLVTVTNIIGCVGQARTTIGKRPAIIVTQLTRTVTGVYGNIPCIDNATFSVYGGLYGPNYTVSLVNDVTGANITYDNNYTITLTRVCRTVQYVVAVKDGDGLCLNTFISSDPQFGFGSGNATSSVAKVTLPPFVLRSPGAFGSGNGIPPVVVKERKSLNPIYLLYAVAIMWIPVALIAGISWCLRTTSTDSRRYGRK